MLERYLAGRNGIKTEEPNNGSIPKRKQVRDVSIPLFISELYGCGNQPQKLAGNCQLLQTPEHLQQATGWQVLKN